MRKELTTAFFELRTRYLDLERADLLRLLEASVALDNATAQSQGPKPSFALIDASERLASLIDNLDLYDFQRATMHRDFFEAVGIEQCCMSQDVTEALDDIKAQEQDEYEISQEAQDLEASLWPNEQDDEEEQKR